MQHILYWCDASSPTQRQCHISKLELQFWCHSFPLFLHEKLSFSLRHVQYCQAARPLLFVNFAKRHDQEQKIAAETCYAGFRRKCSPVVKWTVLICHSTECNQTLQKECFAHIQISLISNSRRNCKKKGKDNPLFQRTEKKVQQSAQSKLLLTDETTIGETYLLTFPDCPRDFRISVTSSNCTNATSNPQKTATTLMYDSCKDLALSARTSLNAVFALFCLATNLTYTVLGQPKQPSGLVLPVHPPLLFTYGTGSDQVCSRHEKFL